MAYRIAGPVRLPPSLTTTVGPRATDINLSYPYIVETCSQSPHLEALQFIHRYAQNQLSAKTLLTRCEQLLAWLRFKDAQAAEQPGRLILRYRRSLEEGLSVRTSRPLARATIISRVDVALHFERWLSAPLPRPEPFSIPLARSSRPRGQHRQKVIPFSREEMTSVLKYLENDRGNSRDPVVKRNWLITLMGFVTGARLDEILSLQFRQVVGWAPDGDGAALVLTRAKGRRTDATGRTIFIPAYLKEKLISYTNGERQKIVQTARGSVPGYREPNALFLNGFNAKKHSIGKAFQQRRACEMIAVAQMACGHTRSIVRFNSRTGEAITVDVSKHTFHHTRHTYVMMAYRHYKSCGLASDQIWRAIADNLGHGSVSTTKEIYGSAIAEDEVRLRGAQFEAIEGILSGSQ